MTEENFAILSPFQKQRGRKKERREKHLERRNLKRVRRKREEERGDGHPGSKVASSSHFTI